MIVGAGPMALGQSPRGLRWPALAVAAMAVALWAFGGALGAMSPEQRLRLVAEAEASSVRNEHDAFTGDAGVREDRSIQIARGETLGSALIRAGADQGDVTRVLAGVDGVFDTRRLRPDQPIDVYFESAGAEAQLVGVAFRSEPGAAVSVNRTFDGQFKARQVLMPLTFEIMRVASTVDKSLYESANDLGATDGLINQFADTFAYDVDFQRDIHPGDAFELVFERFRDDEGRTVKAGDLLFVALDVRGALKSFYRYKRRDGAIDWYDDSGSTARKFLMKTPINGARLSSGFGFRQHPILGYTLLHKGTDFAAPIGTPIMAAGDGVIERAGGFGTYGNYVRIRHSDGYETAYAHMSRFGRGIRAGARVNQQQVIGYVGVTGRSTGPHVHYEVLFNGQQINPMRLKVPTGRNLDGADLAAFKVERSRIDTLRVNSQREAQLHAGESPVTPPVITASFTSAPQDGGIKGGFR